MICKLSWIGMCFLLAGYFGAGAFAHEGQTGDLRTRAYIALVHELEETHPEVMTKEKSSHFLSSIGPFVVNLESAQLDTLGAFSGSELCTSQNISRVLGLKIEKTSLDIANAIQYCAAIGALNQKTFDASFDDPSFRQVVLILWRARLLTPENLSASVSRMEKFGSFSTFPNNLLGQPMFLSVLESLERGQSLGQQSLSIIFSLNKKDLETYFNLSLSQGPSSPIASYF